MANRLCLSWDRCILHSLPTAVNLLTTAGILWLTSCGGSSPSAPSSSIQPLPPPSIVVAVSPQTAAVQAGSEEKLVALVTNDLDNQGVSWSVSCSSFPCGTVSSSFTTSGIATVYTAPTVLPTAGLTIIVTATAVADKSKSSSTTLIPVGHIPGYEVGVDYHSTGIDNDVSGFIAVYDQPQVRQKVQMQLQGMADRGANFIHTSMWVAKPPGPPCCSDNNALITFPMTDQEAANLHAYAQDVAAVHSSGGTRLRLDLALMWVGIADYTVGDRTAGLGSPPITAEEFASRVQTTTDQLLKAVKGVSRPDGLPVVDTIFLDPEVMIGAKSNEDWFLATNYPRFVSVVYAAGFRAAVYFLAVCDQKYVLDDTWTDSDYPILNGHLSMYWIYRSIKFLADNGLPLPSRIDFSCYLVSTGTSYDQLFQRVLDDADATLPSLGAYRLYGVAETNYMDDPAVRLQYAQTFPEQAAQNPRMQRVSFWPNGPGGGQSGAAYPFTLEDFLPAPDVGSNAGDRFSQDCLQITPLSFAGES